MDLQEFLSLVTPDEGYRFVVALEKGEDAFKTKRAHKPFEGVAEAEELVNELNAWENYNTYFSCAAFEVPNYTEDTARGVRTRYRTKKNALSARAIWRDLDVGFNEDGKPKPNAYGTAAEACKAANRMSKQVGLPKPILVLSGNGIHAYWPFNRNVPKEEWLRIAKMSVQVFNSLGVKSDPSRDADITSVLRPPGATHKGKKVDSPHRMVEIISEGGGTVSPEDFIALLSPHYASDPLDIIPSYLKTNEGSAANLAKLTTLVEYPPFYAELTADKCAQIGEFRETGGTTYLGWFYSVNVIKFSVEGREKAHEWSEKHDGYSYGEAEFKMDDWTGKPTLCETFETLGTHCETCKFKGKIKSPWRLGIREEVEPETIKTDVADEHVVEEIPDEIPPLPPPYLYRGGQIQKLTVVDGVPIHQGVCSNVFWFEDRYRSLTGEVVLKTHVRVRTNDAGKWEMHTFELPAALVAKGGSELYAKLGEREIYPSTEKGGKARMDAVVVAMADQLRQRKKEVRAYRHFGWQEDGGFLVGDVRVDAEGENKVLVAGDSAPILMQAFKRNGGSAAEWAQNVEGMYAHSDHAQFQAIVLFGIGSPLLTFYQMPTGCLVNMVGDRGTGKTSAAKVACSAWGSPDHLMTELRSTTEFALYDRIATQHSIPVNIDELTNIEPQKMSTMTYTIMNAQPRQRLKSDGSRAVQILPWETVSLASSNESIRDVVAAYKADASAELSRLIEIEWKGPDQIKTLERRQMDDLLEANRANHGAMGLEFAKWICQNRSKAEKTVLKMREFLEDELKIDKENRFWSAHAAIPLASKLLLEKMGYLNAFNFDDVLGLMTTTITEHKQSIVALTMSSQEAFHAMLTSFSDSIIVTKTLKDARWTTPDTILMHNEPVGRVVLESNDLWLSISAVREWCSDRRVNYKKMMKELASQGMWTENERVYFGRGTNKMTGQIYSWHLDLQKVLGFSHVQTKESDDGHLKLVG